MCSESKNAAHCITKYKLSSLISYFNPKTTGICRDTQHEFGASCDLLEVGLVLCSYYMVFALKAFTIFV